MADGVTYAECADCGLSLDTSVSAMDGRTPCPNCGSLVRHAHIQLSETVTTHESISIEARRPGQRRPYLEVVAGDAFGVTAGKWFDKSRRIDRDNDRYTETVTDPDSGEVLHHCDERLTDHWGHGSAKHQKDKK